MNRWASLRYPYGVSTGRAAATGKLGLVGIPPQTTRRLRSGFG